MKTCNSCNQNLPLDKFYLHSDTQLPYGRCKRCHTAKTNSYNDKQPRANEIYISKRLQKVGVPIMFGKQFSDKQYKNVDLVAYGKYKIECKLTVKNRIWMTKKQLCTDYADYLILLYGKKMYFMPYADIFKKGKEGQRVFTIHESEIEQHLATATQVKEILFGKLSH